MTEEPDLTISRQNEPSAASNRHVVNRWAGRAGYTYNSPGREPLEFHQRMPDYSPTRLIDSPELARSLGVPKLFVKDESMRLGLPAFKALGAWWATYRALCERSGSEPANWRSLSELSEYFAGLRPLTIVAPTDGKYGRAVARFARLLGFDARVFMPAAVPRPRVVAVESEGATVELVDGTYEDAVAAAEDYGADKHVLVADSAVAGSLTIPQAVIDGYSTMFWEISGPVIGRQDDRDHGASCSRVFFGEDHSSRPRAGRPTCPTCRRSAWRCG